MGELSDEDGHDETRDRCEGICQCEQRSGVVGGNVDVISQNTAVHARHEHRADRH